MQILEYYCLCESYYIRNKTNHPPQMNRRNFISNASALTSVSLLPSIETFAQTKAHNFEPADGFSLKIFATSWGYTDSIDSFCALAKKEGYEGIEVWWSSNKQEQDELFAALKKHQLAVGFLAGSGDKDPLKNLEQFKKMVNEATGQTIVKPTYINCHSGKDYFTYEQNKPFIDFTTEVSKKTGIPIYHETHRGKMLFAGHITKNFLDKNPDLRLTLRYFALVQRPRNLTPRPARNGASRPRTD
ncbi:MAG: hypothetical protein U5N85_10775 [Arcicella sp.]|nr:hypothetical protein [Arcicella sp.]